MKKVLTNKLIAAVIAMLCFSSVKAQIPVAYIPNYYDNTVSVVNMQSMKAVGNIGVGANPISVCVSPDNQSVYVLNSGDNTISVISTTTNTVAKTIDISNINSGGVVYKLTNPTDMAISGGVLYVIGQGTTMETIEKFDANSGSLIGSFTVFSAYGGNKFACSVTGDEIAIFGNGQPYISVYSTSTSTRLRSFTQPGEQGTGSISCVYDPYGRLYDSYLGYIYYWEASTPNYQPLQPSWPNLWGYNEMLSDGSGYIYGYSGGLFFNGAPVNGTTQGSGGVGMTLSQDGLTVYVVIGNYINVYVNNNYDFNSSTFTSSVPFNVVTPNDRNFDGNFIAYVNNVACISLNITSQPTNTTVNVGDNPSFAVSANGGSDVLTYQWQESQDAGVTYNNLSDGLNSDGASYSGTATNNLSFTGQTFAMNGYQYMCQVIDVTSGCSFNTASAILTVHPPHTICIWTGAVSTDYFDANNWQNDISPLATDNVLISGANIIGSNWPDLTVQGRDATVNNFVITSGAYFYGVNYNLNINGDATIGDGKPYGTGVNSNINIAGNASFSGFFQYGIYTIQGNATFDGSNGGSSSYSSFSVAGDVQFLNNPTISSGALIMNGATNQKITGSGNVNHLEINGGNHGTTTIASGVGNMVYLNYNAGYDALIVWNNGTLKTNNNLTLVSSSDGTARFDYPDYNGTINGTVTVERYIPQSNKAFRDLGVCVSGAGSIASTWGPSLVSGYPVYNFTATATPAWYAIATSASLQPNKGYRVLIDPSAAPVTLSYSGNLLTGDQSPVLTGGQDNFSFISNPYASQVDFNSVTSSGLYSGYWYLNPTTFTGQSYENYSYFGTDIGSSNIYASTASQYLQPGQAFFVCSNTAGTPTLTFKESAIDNSHPQINVFGSTALLNRIATGLFSNGNNLDGAVSVFNSNFSNGIGKEDGLKISSGGENITFKVAGKDLCANGWGLPTASDILPMHLYNLKTNTNYTLKLNSSQFVGNGLRAYLKDDVLNTQTLLTDSIAVSFTTTTDTASYSNRYSIVFNQSALPVKNIIVTATASLGDQVTIKWKTVGESNIANYKVERSLDGITFSDLATVSPATSSNYSYVDATASEGINYYRIKATVNTGVVEYSKVVSCQLPIVNYQLKAYPNPVTTNSFKLSIASVGKYTISIVDKLGKTIYSTTLNHTAATALENVTLDKQWATGCYTVKATDENGKVSTTQIIIEQ